MQINKSWVVLVAVVGGLAHGAVRAAEPGPRAFVSGSLQQLASQAKGPLVVRFWSVECEYCMKEMGMLKQLGQRHPDWRVVLVSTDGMAHAAAASKVLRREGYDPDTTWIFAEPDAQRLRFDIDRRWHGELPRTYLYVAGRQVAAYSGASDAASIEKRFAVDGGAR